MRTALLRVLLSSGAAGLALGGCGITTEDYDARVAELRKANERIRVCDDSVKQAQGGLSEAQQGVDEMRTRVRELQAERAALGLDTDAGRLAIKRALDEVAREKPTAAARASEKAQLTQSLHEELEAGVIWLDERHSTPRLVIPEEVLFSTGSSALGPPGKKILDVVARELKLLPTHRLLVASYVDSKPAAVKPDKQMAEVTLTTDRARRVAEYLAKQGIEPLRLSVAGMGSLDPIADNAVEDSRARNRRLEIELLDVMQLPAPPKPPEKVSTSKSGAPSTKGNEAGSTSTAGSTTKPTAGSTKATAVKAPPAPVAPSTPMATDDPGL